MTIKSALKNYKAEGRTNIKLNATSYELAQALLPLAIEDLPELTLENTATDNAARRVNIININSPQWGVDTLIFDGQFYLRGQGGRFHSVLDPAEFKFWKLVPSQINENLTSYDLKVAADTRP
jgi:hypothetical protein